MDEAARRARDAKKFRKGLIRATKREIRDIEKVMKGKEPYSPNLRPYLVTLKKKLDALER